MFNTFSSSINISIVCVGIRWTSSYLILLISEPIFQIMSVKSLSSGFSHSHKERKSCETNSPSTNFEINLASSLSRAPK
uniref:Uncharacterized protein n=1 Tax=Lepeophtheirus salmonis TaxID=72036 RepID=A0A0K2TR68_LEPSM